MKCAKEQHFDVILMDIRMPEMNGIEAARAIREFDMLTPIIAVTSNAFESDKRDALAAGCSAFVTKPLRIQTLMQEIERIVNYEL